MRLIDADAIQYTMLYKENFMTGTGKEAQGVWKSEIDKMPTVDAVPVIRCKDCKWYYRGGATCMFWDGANGMCGDDFCGKGKAERKEE